MDKRAIRSSATGVFAARLLAIALAAGATVMTSGSAQAADPKKPREKMVELNKQALFFYESKDWTTAKDLLSEALDIAEAVGLENNKMTARTYLHLGAVYWVGFRDREAAIQNFSMSKKIRPDIRLTPLIETADLKAVFDAAPDQVDSSLPAVASTPPPPVVQAPKGISPSTADDGEGEPDLPSSMSAPLMCTLPTIASPNRALTIRCALRPGLNASLVRIHYRPRGIEAYQAQDMRRTARGWYIVTLPRDLMQKGSLLVYFDARDDSDNQVASLGQFAAPSVIAVRERSSSGGGGLEEDPLRRINEQARAEKYEAGLHRRRAGSLWLGMGAGMGWGYVPAGNLEWERNVRVSALTTTTGLLHLAPEVGYMWSDNFGLALQGRIELIRQQQAIYPDPVTGQPVQLAANIPDTPATVAPALFARAIGYLDLSKNGNLRLSYSGDLGGGYIRLPIKPRAEMTYDSVSQAYVPDYGRTIARTDTRPVGWMLVGASVGVSWNISRNFAIAWNVRALSGLPSWGAIVEGTLSTQLAFGTKSDQESLPEDDEE
jgi:hypothetical protein